MMVFNPFTRRAETDAASARLQQGFPTPQGMPLRPMPPQSMPLPQPKPQPQQYQQPNPIKSFREPAPQNQQFKIASAMPLGNPNQSDRPIYPTNPVPQPRPQPQPRQPQQYRPETPMPRDNYLLTRAAEEANLRGRQIGRFQDALRMFGGNRTRALHHALWYGA